MNVQLWAREEVHLHLTCYTASLPGWHGGLVVLGEYLDVEPEKKSSSWRESVSELCRNRAHMVLMPVVGFLFPL